MADSLVEEAQISSVKNKIKKPIATSSKNSEESTNDHKTPYDDVTDPKY
jgi:hypothetical protein